MGTRIVGLDVFSRCRENQSEIPRRGLSKRGRMQMSAKKSANVNECKTLSFLSLLFWIALVDFKQ